LRHATAACGSAASTTAGHPQHIIQLALLQLVQVGLPLHDRRVELDKDGHHWPRSLLVGHQVSRDTAHHHKQQLVQGTACNFHVSEHGSVTGAAAQAFAWSSSCWCQKCAHMCRTATPPGMACMAGSLACQRLTKASGLTQKTTITRTRAFSEHVAGCRGTTDHPHLHSRFM
jgi:hypothetical protein